MRKGDLVRFTSVFGNDIRVGLVLIVDIDFTKTTFGWVRKKHLEVLSEER